MNRHAARLVIGPAALLLSVLASAARAETTACTAITSVPYTITVPGIYCLTADISASMASGYAIDIQTNSVVLDFNGHKIGNLGAGPGTAAIGVYAWERQNVTIVNGTIRGFEYGIVLGGNDPYVTSQGHVIEGLRIDQNTHYGIFVMARGSVVRGNQVVAIGGTSLFPNADAFGIVLMGPGNRVIDNDVINVTPVGSGASRAIFFLNADDGVAVNNRITAAGRGIQYDGSSGKYRDNLTSSVATPYIGGTNVGNNN